MATDTDTTETTDAAPDDPGGDFINRVAAKYEKDDAKLLAKEDGVEPDDDDAPAPKRKGEKATKGTKGSKAASTDASADEHPDADTPESRDDDDSDSADDSEEDDDADHTDDDESEESDDDDAADDEAEQDEDDDEEADALTDATKAALGKHGANLSLEDVPKRFRPVVAAKLKNIDAAFTRAQAEATKFRGERSQFEADKRFREANPELVITELLNAHPELLEVVNRRLDKLEDPDSAEVFKILVANKRKEELDTVTAESEKAAKDADATAHWDARIVDVTTYTRRMAAEAGLPARYAEAAVAQQIIDLKRELTNPEIDAIVRAEAKQYAKDVRAQLRGRSQDVIKQRDENRRTTAPAAKAPRAAASPRPQGTTRAETIDWNDEDSRRAAMMRTARRVMPGLRDH